MILKWNFQKGLNSNSPKIGLKTLAWCQKIQENIECVKNNKYQKKSIQNSFYRAKSKKKAKQGKAKAIDRKKKEKKLGWEVERRKK